MCLFTQLFYLYCVCICCIQRIVAVAVCLLSQKKEKKLVFIETLVPVVYFCPLATLVAVRACII